MQQLLKNNSGRVCAGCIPHLRQDVVALRNVQRRVAAWLKSVKLTFMWVEVKQTRHDFSTWKRDSGVCGYDRSISNHDKHQKLE